MPNFIERKGKNKKDSKTNGFIIKLYEMLQVGLAEQTKSGYNRLEQNRQINYHLR